MTKVAECLLTEHDLGTHVDYKVKMCFFLSMLNFDLSEIYSVLAFG